MKQIALKERLMRYLLQHHGFIASGELQRLTMQYAGQTARTAVRRLQELHEAGKIERKLIKGHAFYKAKEQEKLPTPTYLDSVRKAQVAWFESLPDYGNVSAA